MRQRVTASDAARISELSDRLGSLTFRTLLTGTEGASKRLMRPERLDALVAGRGKLSEAERERLQLIATNAPAIRNLRKKNAEKREFKVNRALRNWVTGGKTKDQKKTDSDAELDATKALGFLGVNPSEGSYYVRKRKT